MSSYRTVRKFGSDPYVARVAWAQATLISAGMGSQVRVITKAANEAAGSDHTAYRAYVQRKIDEYTNLQRSKPTRAMDVTLDVIEMLNEGFAQADIAQYLRRAYGLA